MEIPYEHINKQQTDRSFIFLHCLLVLSLYFSNLVYWYLLSSNTSGITWMKFLAWLRFAYLLVTFFLLFTSVFLLSIMSWSLLAHICTSKTNMNITTCMFSPMSHLCVQVCSGKVFIVLYTIITIFEQGTLLAKGALQCSTANRNYKINKNKKRMLCSKIVRTG